jgi:hypothetical protein
MPYEIRENSDGSVRVVNKQSGKVHAKSTTREKANSQIRLLHAQENNPDFKPRSSVAKNKG